jgi:hypothetical protein
MVGLATEQLATNTTYMELVVEELALVRAVITEHTEMVFAVM